ncbi:hypothetical protein Q7P37_001328 [Cladosporium fusiforme]
MSIWRGIQSAIFYYVSCAPCADASTRKQRKRQAVHDEQLRTELEAAHPDYPSQAAPGSVNPNWAVEIESGPRMPRKQMRAQDGNINRTRSRDLDRVESKGTKAMARVDSKKNLKQSATQSSTSSKAHSTVDVSYTRRHLMVYQRPDEELWGAPSTSSVHLPARPITARTKSSTTPDLYHQRRHPAVNDLHPPTTRKITAPEEIAWMLQPLPSASVMTGKEEPAQAQQPANFRSSRSNSDASRKSPKSIKSTAAPLTPIEAYEDAMEDPRLQTPDSDRAMTKPEDWIWEATKRDVSSRRSLEW